MLDTFEILTTSGVVLWSRSYATINPSIINSFITDVFIEEKGSTSGAKDDTPAANTPPYRIDQHTLKWTFVKELGIIFVVGFLPSPLTRLAWGSDNACRPSTGRFCTCRGSTNSWITSKPSS